MEETLQLAMDLNCEFINFYTVMAYPGSQLHEWASAKEDYLPKKLGRVFTTQLRNPAFTNELCFCQGGIKVQRRGIRQIFHKSGLFEVCTQ